MTVNISAPIDVQSYVCCIESDGLLLTVASANIISSGLIECGPVVIHQRFSKASLAVSGTLVAALERYRNLQDFLLDSDCTLIYLV